MSIDELLSSFMSLNDDERTIFLEQALAASQSLPFDPAWLDELEYRAAEVDAGRMPTEDWNEARQRVHTKYFPHG